MDGRELEEAGAEFDDPEQMVTLEGMIDDPDGLGGPTPRTRTREADPEGWDLDEPLVSDTEVDADPGPIGD